MAISRRSNSVSRRVSGDVILTYPGLSYTMSMKLVTTRLVRQSGFVELFECCVTACIP